MKVPREKKPTTPPLTDDELVCAIPEPKQFEVHFRQANQSDPAVFTVAYDIVRNWKSTLAEELVRLQGYVRANERGWTFSTDLTERSPVTRNFLKGVENECYGVLPYVSRAKTALAGIRDGRSLVELNESYITARRAQDLALEELEWLEDHFEQFQRAKKEFGIFINRWDDYLRKLPLKKVTALVAIHVEAAITVAQHYALAREQADYESLRARLTAKRAAEFPVDSQAAQLLALIEPISNGSTPVLKKLAWPQSADLLMPPTLT